MNKFNYNDEDYLVDNDETVLSDEEKQYYEDEEKFFSSNEMMARLIQHGLVKEYLPL